MLATTHGTHVHELAAPCIIENHPPVCPESFCGHPLGTITTDGPPKIGPILKSSQKKVSIYAHFSLEHESSFFLKLGSSKTFLGGILDLFKF
jgi:hypothetical protein